jgi:hypothetical protein
MIRKYIKLLGNNTRGMDKVCRNNLPLFEFSLLKIKKYPHQGLMSSSMGKFNCYLLLIVSSKTREARNSEGGEGYF